MIKHTYAALFLAFGCGLPCAFAEPLSLDAEGPYQAPETATLSGSTLAPDPALALTPGQPAAPALAPLSLNSLAAADAAVPDAAFSSEREFSTAAAPKAQAASAPREHSDLPEPISAVLVLLLVSLLARAHRNQAH
jgi:hypothetical protein